MVCWVPSLAAVAAVCAAIIFPRAPTWKVADMKYKGISANTDLTINALIDMTLEVLNPNYVPATLNGIVMTMFHEDLEGEEAPYGIVKVREGTRARLPARGSALVQAQLEIVSMPLKMGMGIANEVREAGTLTSRSLAVMDVTVFGGGFLIEADCEQTMKADVFPVQITDIKCKYYYKNIRVLMLP